MFVYHKGILLTNRFLDLAVAKSLQSTRTVTDADAADDDDVQTTTGYTGITTGITTGLTTGITTSLTSVLTTGLTSAVV